MSGVYNRKLFQTPSARDQLRQAGGIMSSSPDLMMSVMSKKQPQKPRAPIGYEDGGSVLNTGLSMLNMPASLPSLVLEKFSKAPKAVDVTDRKSVV